MRKALRDPEFHREFLKLVGDEVEPMMPEELTKIIRETPRDPEVIDLLKKSFRRRAAAAALADRTS